MEAFWQSPEVQGALIAFAVGLALTILIRFAFGASLGNRFALLAVAAAFVVAYAWLESIAWPATTSKQKVFWLGAVAIAAGGLLTLARAGRGPTLACALLFPVVALAWLEWRSISSGPSSDVLIMLAILYVASVLVAVMLLQARSTGEAPPEADRGRINAPALLMLACFSGGAVSISGAFVGMGLMLLATGAALGAYLLVNWLMFIARGEAFGFGPIGVVGVGGSFLTCVYVIALFGDSINRGALAIVLLIFLADIVGRRLRAGQGRAARILEPVNYGIVAAIPAVAAVALAILTADSDSGY